jgi:tetratricopeptide (TPR) repeat protein
MRRLLQVLVLVVAPVGTSFAAPYGHVVSNAPAYEPAEKLWSAAHDTASWRAAAEAFFAIADGSASDADKRAAGRSGWAAARNALADDARATMEEARPYEAAVSPRPLPPVDAWFVHATEIYERLDHGAPDAVVAEFIRANTLHRYDQLEAANVLYLDIIATHPEHAVAEYAVNVAADTFVRLGQFDQVVAFVDRLRADKRFLALHPNLLHMLHLLHLQSLRNGEPVLEGSRGPHSYARYAAEGEGYLASIEPGESDTDELLYDAMVSFEQATDYERALEVGQRFLTGSRASKLAPRVIARMARIEGDVGRYADAARDLERYVELARGDRDATDALGDALFYRIGLGDLDRAAHDVDAVARLPHPRAGDLARATAQLVRAELDAGDRRAARARAASLRSDRDLEHVALGALLADVACPVALVDDLCPRARDPHLLARARGELRRATDRDDPSDIGRLILVDLDFETGGRDLEQRYRELTGDRSETRVIAHERLGRLALRAGHPDEAAGEFALCITEARANLLGADWLARCERERAALGKPPVVAPVLERVREPLGEGVTALEQL